MTPHDVIRQFGSQTLAARALGVTFQAVSKWCKLGFVPYSSQCEIQVRTAGALVASWLHVPTRLWPRSVQEDYAASEVAREAMAANKAAAGP